MFKFAFLSRRTAEVPPQTVTVDIISDVEKIRDAELELRAIVRDVKRVIMDKPHAGR